MQLPNPLKTPSFLQKLQWVVDPVKYLESAARQYPDIFTAEIIGFGDTIVFVSHPQAIQKIFANENNQFAAPGDMNRTLQPLIGDSSLIMLDGDRHKKRRQLLMPQFHGDRMRVYGELICNLTAKVLSQLSIDQPFTAHTTMKEISLQVILQAVFGLYEGERCQKLKHLLPKFLSNVFDSPLVSSFLFFPWLQKDLGSWSLWGKFLRDRQEIDQLIYDEIAERRAQLDVERKDILSLLMSTQDEAGNSMTDSELRDELITLMIGGYETTATSIAWALYWIHHKPEVREKLLKELDTLGDSPDPMNIFRLPYLTSVCNETLRIASVTIFTLPRVVKKPVELVGHSLDPGTVVTGAQYLVHHREDIYPESHEFKPDRFLDHQFSSSEFIPFGGGVRGCVGRALAMFEMKLVLATILLNYQLALTNSRPEKTIRKGTSLAPANGVRMIIKKRLLPQKSPVSIVATSAS
ncbi:cytochrome P450 [Nostoc sp. FACHB-87]|uniref:cytochrome P450 n=1 Tax=Nostocaceae TaxID=1162 RepID=UPI00168A0ED2|nr:MULTISPECIES: cytochrome P450 [Nostocaceae]MBD2452673.1 cytochrome P450 [Nostoc sp. FACHB-87]MBD2473604.1 cytochrome P450 [Anabaena sp. FACHB-83]